MVYSFRVPSVFIRRLHIRNTYTTYLYSKIEMVGFTSNFNRNGFNHTDRHGVFKVFNDNTAVSFRCRTNIINVWSHRLIKINVKNKK